MPNYNDNFNSADWEHKRRKHRKSKRRHNDKVSYKKGVELANCSGWTPFYIKDEVPVYDKEIVKTIPAYTEKEKCFYIIKNGRYWYTDSKGVDHYLDEYTWKETGREIYHPERVIRTKHLVGHKKIKPYLRRCYLSGRRGYAKDMTHKLARRRFDNLENRLVEGDLPDNINTSKSSDHRCFSYGHTVW